MGEPPVSGPPLVLVVARPDITRRGHYDTALAGRCLEFLAVAHVVVRVLKGHTGG